MDQILKQTKMLNSSEKLHSFEVVDNIYTWKKKEIDKNLNDLYHILKKQAKSIYFERKVEYINLMAQKKEMDQKDIIAKLL